MIVGVGTDIVMVSRIAASLERFGERFARRILTESELEGFQKAASGAHFVAKRFAAKEAVSKAFGTGMRDGVAFRTIEVKHDQSGKPMIELNGAAKQLAESKGIVTWHLSLSDERDHALAFVVAEG